MPRLPQQRWCIPPSDPALTTKLAVTTAFSGGLAQVLVNRGIDSAQSADQFLNPDQVPIPPASAEFSDLPLCVDILEQAVRQRHKISICGDYDVDGMTSTALLLRTIKALGGLVDYAIPSRMHEGYGINQRIVRELHQEGTQVMITVDNGIAAKEPIALARQLGMTVIITDHHELPSDPADLPPAHGILNPKYKLAETSPYASIAGVGMAYVLALELSYRFGKRQELADVLLELFTLGTIADLAPLTGINRILVSRGLRCLANSQIVGVRALIATTQKQNDQKAVKEFAPEMIGFQLGPRINAIGRIDDPAVVIDLLTTDDPAIAQARAQKCHEINQKRQSLCSQIEAQAIAYVAEMTLQGKLNLAEAKALVIVDCEVQEFLRITEETGWHHGVIGIVASRLVERYGAPVFIGSLEAEHDEPLVRFSVRGIPEFHVFQALEFIKDLRIGGGGHKAAGGFTMPKKHLAELRSRLKQFAEQSGITEAQIMPFIEIDSQLDLKEISPSLWKQVQRLQPCGIGNPNPVFYTPNVRVVSQSQRGTDRQYLSLGLDKGNQETIKAFSFKWGEYCPIPNYVDVAYRLKENEWQGKKNIELELIGLRYPTWEIVFECKSPPDLVSLPEFKGLFQVPRPLPRPLLLYGYDRPAEKFQGDVDYDRPTRQYRTLVLWSLPPSPLHLQWLIHLAKPQQVLIGKALPPLPSAEEMQDRVCELFGKSVLNLLEISQQWWVSPAVIISSLRSLGYPCSSYSPTQSLTAELQNMQEWYTSSLDAIARSLSNKTSDSEPLNGDF